MWGHIFRSPCGGPDADRRNQAGAVPRAGLVLSHGWAEGGGVGPGVPGHMLDKRLIKRGAQNAGWGLNV